MINARSKTTLPFWLIAISPAAGLFYRAGFCVILIEMIEIKKIEISDKNFPAKLKKIPDPPKAIYYKGKLLPDELCFAVIGTRRYSNYGKEAALKISGDLADSGITIISGLAPGIDTFAHLSAVNNNKRTIAVLGTGLDEKNIYPKENISLARKILECGGCLISEYPPGTAGSRFTFPKRNRIISGLSIGILVIEAKEKSGSLITAGYAAKQNKKIYAVPGSIYSLNSKGTNILIKRGAKLADSASDILSDLKILKKTASDFTARPEISAEEIRVVDLLRREPLYLDKIIENVKLSPAKTLSLITTLEMKGIIKNIGGNTFAIDKI